jgi:hypothetical protein
MFPAIYAPLCFILTSVIHLKGTVEVTLVVNCSTAKRCLVESCILGRVSSVTGKSEDEKKRLIKFQFCKVNRTPPNLSSQLAPYPNSQSKSLRSCIILYYNQVLDRTASILCAIIYLRTPQPYVCPHPSNNTYSDTVRAQFFQPNRSSKPPPNFCWP